MHRLSTSFVFGYHGCDRKVGEKILAGQSVLQKSKNEYDWLGPGIYFWEANPDRALDFAREKQKLGFGVTNPYVLGAVIDLRLCLDLTTKESLEYLRDAHESLIATFRETDADPPSNGPKKWMHYLDCAVINRLHAILAQSQAEPIDTVRGVFQEEPYLYQGSAFMSKTHIQIAVVNPACIKAVFRVDQPRMRNS